MHQTKNLRDDFISPTRYLLQFRRMVDLPEHFSRDPHKQRESKIDMHNLKWRGTLCFPLELVWTGGACEEKVANADLA